MDKVNSTDSDLLLVVNVLIWIDAVYFLATGGAGLFADLLLAGPLVGLPVPWLGTQLIIGIVMTRGWRRNKSPARTPAPSPVAPSAPAPSGPSEEP